MKQTKELLFIYNANSGKINAMKDYFHKVISPKAYDCNLCALTYDMLGMKSEWKKAIEKTGLKTTFLHRDEFKEKHHLTCDLPVILLKKRKKIQILLTSQKIKDMPNLNELIKEINKQIIKSQE